MKIKFLATFGLLLAGSMLILSSCHKTPETTDCSNPPAPPKATSNSPVDPKGNIILTIANPQPGAVYSWSKMEGTTKFTATGSTVTRHYNTAYLGAYQVTVAQNGCTSSPYTVYVTTNMVVAYSSGYALEDSTEILTASPVNNAKYAWYRVNGPGDSTFVTSKPYIVFTKVQFTDTAKVYYRVIATDTVSKLVSSDTTQVFVHVATPQIWTHGKALKASQLADSSVNATVGGDLTILIGNAKTDPKYMLYLKSQYDHFFDTISGNGTIIRHNVTRAMTGTYTVYASYRGYKTPVVTFNVNVQYSYRGCPGAPNTELIDTLKSSRGAGGDSIVYFKFTQLPVGGGRQQCWCQTNLAFQSATTDAPPKAITQTFASFSIIDASFIPGQGHCPLGYHIATLDDWTNLHAYSGLTDQGLSDTLHIIYNPKTLADSLWTGTLFPADQNVAYYVQFAKPYGTAAFQISTINANNSQFSARCVRD